MLEYECIKNAGNTCIKVNSDINQINSKRLEDQFNMLIENGEKKVVADLTNINFLDSSGIGVLVRATKRMMKNGGKLVIVNKSSTIESLFSMSNLSSLVNLAENMEKAEEMFNS
jgi:anti-sigma B factor antagonist